jgi:hypothetical protein
MSKNGQISSLMIFLCALIGFAAAKVIVLAVNKYKYSPSYASRFTALIAVVIAALVLGSNYLAGSFGLVVAILGASTAGGYFALIANFAFISSQSQSIGEKIALAQDSQEKITRLNFACQSIQNTFTNYSTLISLFSIFLLFLIYTKTLENPAYLLTDPYLFAGLILGAVVPYFIYSLTQAQEKTPILNKAWLPAVFVVVLPLAIVPLLGTTMLSGLLVGFVLTALLISLRFMLAGSLTRFTIILAILAVPALAAVNFTLLIKLIILGAVIVAAAAIILFASPTINKK